MSNNLGLNWASLLALLVALVAVFLAFWRAKRSPELLVNREQALERRVAELESTVATLQRLLFEKTEQNGALQAEVARLNDRVRQLEKLAPPPQPGPAQHPETLLAVIGADPALKIDLAALREVERENNIRVSRVYPVTRAKLKSTLDRFRVNGRPVRYVHMAVHAGPKGLAFQGEVVDAAWLSENLKNVQVLLINGCQSDEIGDWIGVVPTVVTMREDISHEDAAQFAKVFWSAVASGVLPEDAYYQARDRAPQAVAEFVELN